MTWQPIETAPKDTEILLFRKGKVTWGEWDPFIGEWIWWGDDGDYEVLPSLWMSPPDPPCE